ncbi:DNA (cytosine-5)-methyltransferase 1 [Rhodococcus sp. OK611]|uniref:DNA cytosine methyltransferase n=1 Tax=unclassified Rhodococcus (in: high G+C Gram-positive bacteria) TaxID=192944 RepID=UPI000BD9EFC8|nr:MULTISPECIES: DNA cytosine methyltransferase [unclassified Rhodococcus (in: high G+C Gram-positive bacteria)]PTR42060.1 DNA (cytosine-5)-methyltransferase 1 [Rhodococcus sp. OK611]SNX91493.1 DNA (cytosine-5)-methyltransferase 1 [Rhodococcus sp. OK270]
MLTMTDLFCGAGGSSTGATQVPGVAVRMAANHWDLAIETHNTNHPDTDHSCADISQVDPRLFPRTDILWGSPECTNHSQAKGRKRNIDSTPDLFDEALPDAAAERSRATMWDIPRFAEHHRYQAVITENVVDAAKWVMFPAWLQAMELLGYEHHIVYMNSMHAQAGGDPAPQSRDRMYVVFWRKGNRRPDLERWTRPRAYCPSCDEVVTALQGWKKSTPWGRYRAQYVWRCPKVACRNGIVEPGWLPAAAAIDWSLRGERIGDRSKPLAPKTIARIEAGLAKFAGPDPFIATMRGQSKCHRAADPLTTVSAGGGHHGLLVPVEGRDGKEARAAGEPLRTMTTRNETAFVVPLRANNTPKAVTDPFDTFAAAGLHHAMVTRHNGSRGDGAEMSTPIGEELRTLTTTSGQSLTTWEQPKVDDCMFRMLEPHEIAAGMAFTPGYTILGNKREQVRQAGNAVCPPNARDLVAAVAESLAVA